MHTLHAKIGMIGAGGGSGYDGIHCGNRPMKLWAIAGKPWHLA